MTTDKDSFYIDLYRVGKTMCLNSLSSKISVKGLSTVVGGNCCREYSPNINYSYTCMYSEENFSTQKAQSLLSILRIVNLIDIVVIELSFDKSIVH